MIAYRRKGTGSAEKPAVFLDRDGTLIHDRPGHYLTDPEKLRFYRDSFRALRLLSKSGFRLIIVTNQSGVARGYMTLRTATVINRRIERELAARGVKLDGIYFCPHGPGEDCACRKPAAGLIREAARHHRIKFAGSFVVGDKLSDLRLAAAMKMRGVFLRRGHGRSQLEKHPSLLKKQVIRNGLLAAARWIAKQGAKAQRDKATKS